MNDSDQLEISLFATEPDECGYLPERKSVSLVADPRRSFDQHQFTQLCQQGFRRSGEFIYRPNCPGCAACIPIRIPSARFHPNRSQRRNWKRNADVRTKIVAPTYSDAHFEMYHRYQNGRHAGGGMENPSPESYQRFLVGDVCNTVFIEFHADNQLIGLSVVDQLTDGLSAVYTFFEPEQAKRALGVYAILWQIEHARENKLEWVYLGYWIEDSRKMNYKSGYTPHQLLFDGRWYESAAE